MYNQEEAIKFVESVRNGIESGALSILDFECTVEAMCTKCGEIVEVEPDATRTWCGACDQSAKVVNPLRILGCI